jgi:hypothetical protein
MPARPETAEAYFLNKVGSKSNEHAGDQVDYLRLETASTTTHAMKTGLAMARVRDKVETE